MSDKTQARQAWIDGMGDPITAIKLLRDRNPELSLKAAADLIRIIAAEVGSSLQVEIHSDSRW